MALLTASRGSISSLIRSSYIRIIGTANAKALSQAKQIHQSSLLKQDQEAKSGTGGIRPDKWDQRYLVWTKKYPSIADIPKKVPEGIMDKARNQMRIRINIFMIIMTAVISFITFQWTKLSVAADKKAKEAQQEAT